MRFALVDNKQKEPKAGLKGLCPGCLEPVVAKCGEQRVHHWAHERNKMCDSWWEPETEWHRSWKNHFPNEWQEVFLPDEQTGEKHIADIRTNHALVIEFQHSSIKPQERFSREKFYRNMIWVVDGSRLKGDYPRFLKAKNHFEVVRKGLFRVSYPEECFPVSWLDSSVPVIFDFHGIKTLFDHNDARNALYCLFPVRIDGSVVIAEVSRKSFVNTIISGEWSERTGDFMKALNHVKQERQAQRERLQQKQINAAFQKFSGVNRYRRSRRF